MRSRFAGHDSLISRPLLFSFPRPDSRFLWRFEGEKAKKALVEKSARTRVGTEDWVRL